MSQFFTLGQHRLHFGLISGQHDKFSVANDANFASQALPINLYWLWKFSLAISTLGTELHCTKFTLDRLFKWSFAWKAPRLIGWVNLESWFKIFAFKAKNELIWLEGMRRLINVDNLDHFNGLFLLPLLISKSSLYQLKGLFWKFWLLHLHLHLLVVIRVRTALIILILKRGVCRGDLRMVSGWGVSPSWLLLIDLRQLRRVRFLFASRRTSSSFLVQVVLLF